MAEALDLVVAVEIAIKPIAAHAGVGAQIDQAKRPAGGGKKEPARLVRIDQRIHIVRRRPGNFGPGKHLAPDEQQKDRQAAPMMFHVVAPIHCRLAAVPVADNTRLPVVAGSDFKAFSHRSAMAPLAEAASCVFCERYGDAAPGSFGMPVW